MSQPRLQIPVTAALALLLSLPAYTLFHQPCDATDTPNARAALFHSPQGTEPTDEYTPATADNDALRPGSPTLNALCTPHKDETGQALLRTVSPPTVFSLRFSLPCSGAVVLNRRQYPAWTVNDDGIPVRTEANEAGLIVVDLPAGQHNLKIGWRRTPDQTLGLILSTLALATYLFLVKPPRRLSLP